MNWPLIGGMVGALIINEIGEVSPALARKILRLAARVEAGPSAEKDLIYNELCAIMDEKAPGKLTKLGWAVGRLGFSVRFGLSRFPSIFRSWRQRAFQRMLAVGSVILGLWMLAGSVLGEVHFVAVALDWLIGPHRGFLDSAGFIVIWVVGGILMFLWENWRSRRAATRERTTYH